MQKREYCLRVSGQAKKDSSSGQWTHYMYANGRKIAMAPGKENVLQVAGSYSGGWMGVGISPPAPALAGYVFRAGDVLLVRQRKFGANVHGGILIFGDGVGSFFNDQDGQRADDDLLGDGTWHNRRISLDPLGGKTYSGLGIGGGTSTDYTFQFASIAVASTDGTVRTVFNGTADASTVSVPAGTDSVHFYAGDHLGTAQLELDAAGNPLWRGDFAPFGQEIDPNPTTNHYKFTGKERDAESGLDYFGARYYTSNLGRWMSPDWADKPEAVPYSDLANPQSLNLYGYVNNNPLSKADADGHDCCEAVLDFLGGIGRGAAQSVFPTSANAPSPNDSMSSLFGQLVASGIAGVLGTNAAVTGGGMAVAGGVAAPASGGASLAVSAEGVALAGAGVVVAKGAAINVSAVAQAMGAHGNTAGNQPAELYEKTDKDGNLEKHGVSQDASKRYSKAEIGEGKITVTDRGPRKEMLAKERHNVETNPGPKNREPWAGKKRDR